MSNRSSSEGVSVDPWQVRTTGAMDILPLAIAVIPWGILCGSLSIEVGLSTVEALLMSALVFAGAAQLGGLSIISQGGSLASISGTTLIISSRHALYSATFREDVLMFSTLKKMAIAFLLTDEMFAVTENYRRKVGYFSADYAIASGFTFYVLWNISTLIGVVLGQQISSLSELGLDFAIAATFIAIVVPLLKNKPIVLASITSFVSSYLLDRIGFSQGLLVATVVGMVVGFSAIRVVGSKR